MNPILASSGSILTVPVIEQATKHGLFEVQWTTSSREQPLSDKHKPHSQDSLSDPMANQGRLAQCQPSPQRIVPTLLSSVSLGSEPRLDLSFQVSLNYLTVIGGGNNSTLNGECNDHLFLNNGLNHLLWWVNADASVYHQYTVPETARVKFKNNFDTLCKAFLMQALVEQIASCKNHASRTNMIKWLSKKIIKEISENKEILVPVKLHQHGLYVYLKNVSVIDSGQGSHCNDLRASSHLRADVCIYNTYMGLAFHNKKTVANEQGKRKIKYQTEKIFPNIQLTEKKLQRLISMFIHGQKNHRLELFPITRLYLNLRSWRGRTERRTPKDTGIYQSPQKYQDCLQKSLLCYLKHHLDSNAYQGFKKSLLQRSHALAKINMEKLYKTAPQYHSATKQRIQVVLNRLKEKSEKKNACQKNIFR